LAYQLLGVVPGDSERKLNKAFRRRLFEVHPDREGGNEAKARQLNHIYDVLRRNLVNGRVPAPEQIQGIPRPRPQPQVRIIQVYSYGGASTTTSSNTTTYTGFGGGFYVRTGTGGW
jgi:hypothetical protein